MLTNQTKGHDLSPLKKKCPSSTSYKYGCISWPERGENRVQKSPKISLLLCFLFQPTLLPSFPSLSTVSSAPEDPTEAFLLHQNAAAQPPCKPKSSPVAEPLPRPPVPLPLQIFFSFFHPALPSATVSATALATVITSAAPRVDQPGLHRRQVVPSLRCCQPGCCMQNEFSFALRNKL